MGSSQLLEFLLALLIGGLAVLVAMLCIGFLLVEPVRSPPSEGPTYSLSGLVSSEECAPVERETKLPDGCTLGGRQTIPVSACSLHTCPCNQHLVRGVSTCCCRGIQREVLTPAIQCPRTAMAPLMSNTTACGCVGCDDLQVTVTLVVVATGSNAIAAARVFRLDSVSELTLLGITNTNGTFRYDDVVGAGPVVYRVQAVGYLAHTTAALALIPSHPSMRREVVLTPSMNVNVGLGGAPLTLRLGSMLSIHTRPNSFIDVSGEVYEDMVIFRGCVVEVDNETARATIPEAPFQYLHPETGELRQFSLFVGLVLDFVDRSGQPLRNPSGLRLMVSIAKGEEPEMEVMLMTFDPFLGVWNMTSELSEVEPLRRQRQVDLNPVVFEGQERSLAFFQAVAANRMVNCYLQARLFMLDGLTPPPSNNRATVTLQQRALLANSAIPTLVQFVGETNRDQTRVDHLEFNALCLPIACDDIVESTLVASDSATGSRLLPVDFADTVFNVGEVTPLVLSTAFLFTEVTVSQANETRPFYDSSQECAAAGSRVAADPSKFFSFRETESSDIQSPMSRDACFLKILINSCFGSNEVTVTSINTISGNVDRTEIFVVGELPPVTTAAVTMDTPITNAMTTGTTDGVTDEDVTTGSGMATESDMVTMTTDTFTTGTTTTDPTTPTMPPAGPFVCNADTATMRGMCLPYVCEGSVRVLVRANASNSFQDGFCVVTSLSVLLQGSPFISNPEQVDQLIIDSVVNPGQDSLELRLLATDFNDPNLGLYADVGGSDMAQDFARQRCNAGLGPDAMSPNIDLSQGYTAIFTCFEDTP